MGRIVRWMAAGAVVAALAMASAATASPVCGDFQDKGELNPQKSQTYPITCKGRAETRVSVDVDLELLALIDQGVLLTPDPAYFNGEVMMRLEVLDAEGQVVACDTDVNPSVSFTPEKTATFRVRVTSLSVKKTVQYRITAE